MTLVFALLAPVAGVPPMGAGWPGGGGGICDMDQSPPVGWLLRGRLWVDCPENAIAQVSSDRDRGRELTLLGSPGDDRLRSTAKLPTQYTSSRLGADT